MGRVNQDYYKLGGGTAGSGSTGEGRFGQQRTKAAAEQAKLRRDAPHLDRPPEKAPREGPRAEKRAHAQAQTGRIQAPRAPEKRPAERVQKAKPQGPVATVQAVHPDKPQHGKTRRASKKRHDVAVLQEMQAHHAGVVEEQRPPAPVADLRDRRLRRERPEDHGPTTLPPKTQGILERTWDLGRDAAMLVWELATAPVTVARLLARLREREA